MITNKDLSIDSKNGKITLNGNKYDLETNVEIEAALKDVYSVMGQNGAKNLIPYPYTNAYRTTNGVTITEGSITGSCVFNGTSTGRVDAQLGYRNSNALILLPSVQYCLSIKTDGSFVGNLTIEAWNKGTTTYAKSIARVTPNSTGSDYKEVKFSVTQSDINNYDIAVLIYGNSANTFNNVTVYPMLRLAADTDNSYQPYAKTNKELTEVITTINAQITPNNLGTGNYVDLTAYTLELPYTATNDGYVLVNSQNSNSIVLKVEAVMSTGAGSSTIKTFAATDTYQGDGMFIRKGMKIYGTRSLTTTGFVRFYPLQ